MIVTEVLIILLLVIANGVFAMSETAIVAVRKRRLRRLAEKGDTRARAALDLSESPNRFLSTVQIGITLVGVLAGAFGGATLAGEIAGALERFPTLAPYGEAIGVGAVVIMVTVLSVVIGEMVPKRLALNNPLEIALKVAKPVRRLAAMTSPVVTFLGASTDLVLKIVGFKPKAEPVVTEDEVRAMLEQGHHAGVFFKTEKEMAERALALDRKCVADVMTPRPQIVWINVSDTNERNWQKIAECGHSYFPVHEGDRDNVIGLISVKSLWAQQISGRSGSLRSQLISPLFVPERMTALRLLETFRQTRKHMALVGDEFGTVQGLVTLVDVLEEIVGDIPAVDEPMRARVVKRDEGSWLVDAGLELDELKKLLGVEELPGEDERAYQTLGGFVLFRCQRFPREGEWFEWSGHRFEVADMDRHYVDKILIRKLPSAKSKLDSKKS